MRIQHRHQSLNTRLANENPDAVAQVLAKHRSECSVLTLTESNGLGNALRETNWAVFREDGDFRRGDPAVCWATDVWQKRDGFVEQLSRVTYDGRRPHAAVVRLMHKRSEQRVVFIAAHMPAHLRQDRTRARAHDDALDSLRQIVLEQRKNHPQRRFVLTADWNLNLLRPAIQRQLTDALRGTGLHVVPVARGERGSLRTRLVDWAFSDLTSSGDVLERTDVSDHRGVAFTHED